MSSHSPLGRPADRTNYIVRELRDQILSGRLAPGSQLPKRTEMIQSFAAGATTVQRALEQLRHDGFIEVNGRQGTFVVPVPPHLANYALVFSTNPSDAEVWPRFWTALNHECLAMQRGQEYKIQVFYNADQHSDGEDYRRLLQDVKAHRLAGIIFASDPFLLAETSVLEEAGIKRVVIGGLSGPNLASNCQFVSPDLNSFWERAVRHLASQGCRRVAVVMPRGMPGMMELTPAQYIERAGLATEPYWVHGLHFGAPEMARGLVHLLFNKGQVERPDSLIIADDNFVEHATAGLVAAHVAAPHQVQVIAHCNFPYPPPSVVPLTLLGFDARRVLRACVESIRPQDEATSPQLTLVPALFETEITL